MIESEDQPLLGVGDLLHDACTSVAVRLVVGKTWPAVILVVGKIWPARSAVEEVDS